MTDLTSTIARLRELEAKATPGPWSFSAKSETDEGVLTGPDGVDLRKIDAKLMAALRNAASALLDAAERAEKAEAENIALYATNEGLALDLNETEDEFIRLKAERDRLAARVAELEAGLEPFAQCEGSVVVPAEDRGGLALALQSKNRHLEMSVARYYVDAVCDLLAARPGASP